MFGNTHTSSKNRILGGLVYTTITSRAMTYPDRINVVIAQNWNFCWEFCRAKNSNWYIKPWRDISLSRISYHCSLFTFGSWPRKQNSIYLRMAKGTLNGVISCEKPDSYSYKDIEICAFECVYSLLWLILVSEAQLQVFLSRTSIECVVETNVVRSGFVMFDSW